MVHCALIQSGFSVSILNSEHVFVISHLNFWCMNGASLSNIFFTWHILCILFSVLLLWVLHIMKSMFQCRHDKWQFLLSTWFSDSVICFSLTGVTPIRTPLTSVYWFWRIPPMRSRPLGLWWPAAVARLKASWAVIPCWSPGNTWSCLWPLTSGHCVSSLSAYDKYLSLLQYDTLGCGKGSINLNSS